MNIERKSIEGIYNFCDSWCVRCLFTHRCSSYQIQVENGSDTPNDPNATLVQQLTEALALTKQYLDRVRPASEPVAPIADQPVLERQTVPNLPPKHPVTRLAHDYLRQTGDWLHNEKGLLEQAGHQQLRDVKLGIRSETVALAQLNALKDAWEMIKWYRTLIPVKTVSALRRFGDSADDARITSYYIGKAKLVLVSIDRSMLAWQTMLAYFPEKTDELLDVLALLNRLSREMEMLFPDARAFRRPGLD